MRDLQRAGGVPGMNPLVKLLRWCRANVADGRISLCRVEGQWVCPNPCGPCLSVEKRALRAEKNESDRSDSPKLANARAMGEIDSDTT